MDSAAGKASHYSSRKRVPDWRTALARKIWLPKSLYSAIPYFYLVCAASALLATLYIAEWFWLLPSYLLFSFACVHMAVFVFRRRRKKSKPDSPLAP